MQKWNLAHMDRSFQSKFIQKYKATYTLFFKDLCHSFIKSVSQWPFSSEPLKHHYTQTEELGSWSFDRMFTPTTCHVSGLMFICFFSFFQTNWWSSLVEGMLSTGPTLSSFETYIKNIFSYIYLHWTHNRCLSLWHIIRQSLYKSPLQTFF